MVFLAYTIYLLYVYCINFCEIFFFFFYTDKVLDINWNQYRYQFWIGKVLGKNYRFNGFSHSMEIYSDYFEWLSCIHLWIMHSLFKQVQMIKQILPFFSSISFHLICFRETYNNNNNIKQHRNDQRRYWIECEIETLCRCTHKNSNRK